MKRTINVFWGIFLVLSLFLAQSVAAEIKPEVKLHGELEYEYSFSTAEDVIAGFQVDKVVIQPKVKFGDYLKLSAQWYARPKGNSYLNEFHATYTGLPQGFWIDAGLSERAIKDQHSRKTETYSLYGNAFYRDDTYGISIGNWKKKHKAPLVYGIVSLSEGYKIGHKQTAEQTSKYDGSNSDKIIQDDLNDSNDMFYPEIGVNLGINPEFAGIKVDIMGFYYFDTLNKGEKGVLSGYLSADQVSKLKDDNSRTRVGGQINLKYEGARLFGGFLSAADAGLARIAYVAEALYKIKLGDGDVLRSITPVVSYSGYAIDGDPDYNAAESWDRTQIIIAGIIEIVEKTKLKLEYVISGEETGQGGIDNNEFLAQVEVKF